VNVTGIIFAFALVFAGFLFGFLLAVAFSSMNNDDDE